MTNQTDGGSVKNSEAVGAATLTASGTTQNPIDQNKASVPAASIAVPATGNKNNKRDRPATHRSGAADTAGTDFPPAEPAPASTPESLEDAPAQIVVDAPAAAASTGASAQAAVQNGEPLNQEQKARFASMEALIGEFKRGLVVAFFQMIAAFFRIKEEKLYRDKHKSFEAYFSKKWGYTRSHAYRLVGAGEIVQRQEASPRGDTVKLLDTESHYRPLAKLTAEQQDAVLDLIAQWVGLSGQQVVSPRMVEAARVFLHPPTKPTVPDDAKSALAEKFVAAVDAIKAKLPDGTSKEIGQLFDQLRKKAMAFGNPTRSTGIDWTDATWNPLQGCARANPDCDNCYAAKGVATRLASVYPGLARMKKDKKGKKTYFFNNIIRLLPEHLAIPLKDRVPKRYFVNSMSDLFHAKVPDDFITAVFQVMEKAPWHHFQVLTKRPERMAKFTNEYWKGRTPPKHIWLGTSAGHQKAMDDHLPHLRNVKAAVRWLSIEPMIGPITFDSLDGVDWVVVGGESGSKRKMEKAWATDVRDACAKGSVPFFFKQWGEYGEDGKKLKKVKKDGLTPPSLDGVIHNDYPEDVTVEREDRSSQPNDKTSPVNKTKSVP